MSATPRSRFSTPGAGGGARRGTPWGRPKDAPDRRRPQAGDPSASRNLAQLASGDFQSRQANIPTAGPLPSSRSESGRPGRGNDQEFENRRSSLAGGGLLGELDELERGYQSAQNFLYGSFGGAQAPNANPNPDPNPNPFEDALNDPPPDNTTDPDPTDSGEDSSSEDGDSGGEGDGGADDSGGDGGEQTPEPPDTIHPVDVFDFLLVGAHGREGRMLSRAHFDGQNFVLEDESEIAFFPGTVHSFLDFGEDSIFSIEDVNRDGLKDFLWVREVASLGTSIELFLQTSLGNFQVQTSTTLYLERVKSAVLFDIDGDTELELLLVRDGQKRLDIYERVGADWNYREELVLPIEPGLLLVSSQIANGSNFGKLLYIIDSRLQVVLNARAASPIAFSFGLGTPLQRMRAVELDFSHTGNQVDRVRVIEMPDRLLLFEEHEGDLATIGSIELGPVPPFLILGDFFGTGQRETIWLP